MEISHIEHLGIAVKSIEAVSYTHLSSTHCYFPPNLLI